MFRGSNALLGAAVLCWSLAVFASEDNVKSDDATAAQRPWFELVYTIECRSKEELSNTLTDGYRYRVNIFPCSGGQVSEWKRRFVLSYIRHVSRTGKNRFFFFFPRGVEVILERI
ncbi:MAG: hypothetical protein LBF72_00985 [Holosporales bacterium]|jgi:hypothetical protein|nr:hypothetical protein [Holosporales bacterium]